METFGVFSLDDAGDNYSPAADNPNDIASEYLKNCKRKNKNGKDGKDNYTTEIVAEQMQLLWGTVASHQRRIEAYSGVFGRIVVLDGNQGAITEAPTGVPADAPSPEGKAPHSFVVIMTSLTNAELVSTTKKTQPR